LNSTTLALLWELLQIGLTQGQAPQAALWLNDGYEKLEDVPATLDKLLSDFWSTQQESDFFALAKNCVQSFLFATELQTRLVAVLVDKKILTLDEAFACLSFRTSSAEVSNPSIQKIAELVWLLEQDKKDGFMAHTDDDLLSTALSNLAKEGLS
jgi:hypothetical protein